MDEIRAISAAEVLQLRHTLLRPDLPADKLVYPGDLDDDAGHYGAFVDGTLVGIASVYEMGESFEREPGIWRLRGMAVEEHLRGRGLGARLVLATFDHARRHGGTLYWCQARTVARGFYERLGLEAVGDEFIVPNVGPHYIMRIRLDDQV
jgi:GNAT superfamily N-acetyltransferase